MGCSSGLGSWVLSSSRPQDIIAGDQLNEGYVPDWIRSRGRRLPNLPDLQTQVISSQGGQVLVRFWATKLNFSRENLKHSSDCALVADFKLIEVENRMPKQMSLVIYGFHGSGTPEMGGTPMHEIHFSQTNASSVSEAPFNAISYDAEMDAIVTDMRFGTIPINYRLLPGDLIPFDARAGRSYQRLLAAKTTDTANATERRSKRNVVLVVSVACTLFLGGLIALLNRKPKLNTKVV